MIITFNIKYIIYCLIVKLFLQQIGGISYIQVKISFKLKLVEFFDFYAVKIELYDVLIVKTLFCH